MSDYSAALTHRIAPAILEFLRRTGPGSMPARRLGTAEANAHFEALALELFAVQFALNPPFQALCRSRDVTPSKVSSWRDIPAVPTAAFKELEISCLPIGERIRVFHSSGTTTQRPGRNWHSGDSLALYEASLLPWFARHVLAEIPELEAKRLLAPGEPPAFLSLTPSATEAPHSSLVHMFDAAVRRYSTRDSDFAGCLDEAGAWELDYERILYSLQKSIRADRPLFILGTAFNFVQLLDHFVAGNTRYQLATGSRVLETGGYKGRTRTIPKVELYAAITRHFGIPDSHIGCEYGMCELSSQAYDRPGTGDRRLQFPPWARARVISPENGTDVADGHPGILQVFDLANLVSVAAIQTGDLSVRHGDGSFELLGRAETVEPKGCSLNV